MLRRLARQASLLCRAFRQQGRARREARRAFRDSGTPPVLIYQMGKVGSTTVARSLKRTPLRNSVLHLHFLSEDLLRIREQAVARGDVPVPYNYELGVAVRRELRRFRGTCRIISLMRDPIAREVSNLFEVPTLFTESYGVNLRNTAGEIDADAALQVLDDHLHRPKTFDWLLGWFDRELKAMFGVDVFSRPFPKDAGWTALQAPGVEVLLLRLEDLSRVGPSTLAEFLSLERPVELVVERATAGSSNSYRLVQRRVRVRREVCEQVYASPVVRHFYSEEMIAGFIRRWTGTLT